ncbi:hypothetical protein C3L33_01369, partial [Rhododendron williamsianum]
MANNTSAPGNLSEMTQMLLKDLKSMCSSPSTKKRRTAGQDEEEEQQAAASKVIGGCSNCDRGSNFLALTDPDLLDCPICFNNLTIPVFQCLNGHLACSSCCIKVRNKCPSCSSTIGHNRCRPIEKIIESVKTTCQNQKYGCTEMVFRCKKREHEDMCVYAPCSCPLPDCEFVGSSKKLSLHFSTNHSGSAKRFCYNCSIPIALELRQKSVILQEEQEGTIYILNNWVQNLGNVIDVCCIAPISSKRGLSYDLIATNGGRSVKLQSFSEHVCGWVEHTSPKNFLMVPRDFFGSCGQLKLELRISEGPGVVHANVLSLGHFSTKHSGSAKSFCYNCSIPISLELQQKSVILQEEQEGTIFILNNGVQNLGNVINVCCVVPISSKRGFSYDLLATNSGRSVKLQSSAEHVWGRVEHTTPKSFLMVPSDFFGSRGQLNLELHISQSPGVVHA